MKVTNLGNKFGTKVLIMYNVMLGAQKAMDAPITKKIVLETFMFCFMRFLESALSIAGFGL